MIFGFSFVQLKRIPFPKQGKFLLNNDPNSNCTLIVDEYSYSFVGEGESYDAVVTNFKKKGKIVKELNYRDYMTIYLLTSDENGPYIYFDEDDILSFSLGVSFSDHYDFYKIDE